MTTASTHFVYYVHSDHQPELTWVADEIPRCADTRVSDSHELADIRTSAQKIFQVLQSLLDVLY